MLCRVGCTPVLEEINAEADTRKDYAITHNLTPFIAMQNHYSLVYREEEREMFPTLKVSFLPLCDLFSLSLNVFTLRCSGLDPFRGRRSDAACSRIRSARRRCEARQTGAPISNFPPPPIDQQASVRRFQKNYDVSFLPDLAGRYVISLMTATAHAVR